MRWLIAITLLLGVVTAAALSAVLPAGDRTFQAIVSPVHLLMSVTVPFTGVLLARDLRRSPVAARVGRTFLIGTLIAAGAGVFGDVVGAVAVAIAPHAADLWHGAGTVAVGGVLVQVLAQLVGIGMGLLLRPVAVACLATIVVPLGLWLLLGAVDALQPARAWLTPFGSVQNLLSGRMTAVAWAQWLVVLALWGVGLNAAGLARLRRATT